LLVLQRAAELVKMKKSHGHAQCGLVLFLLLHSFLAPTSLAKKTQISGPVKTVVVLVMENRSFDQMLG
jgi:phospholipase C